MEGGAGPTAYRGEDDVWVAPHGHLVQPDGDPEDHTDGGAPLPQVVELQAAGMGYEGAGLAVAAPSPHLPRTPGDQAPTTGKCGLKHLLRGQRGCC